MIDRFAPIVEETAEGFTTSSDARQIVHPRTPLRTSALRAVVTRSARIGLIQVQAAELTVPTYFTASRSTAGRLYLTQDVNEALRVRFGPSIQPQTVLIFYPGGATALELDHLGITRLANDSSSNISSDERFYLTFTNRSQNPTSWNGTSGPTKTAVWMISDDNVIRASWDCIDLIPFVGITAPGKYQSGKPNNFDLVHPVITMAVDETGLLALYKGGTRTYRKAEMTFKPLDHLHDQVSPRS
ncbi:hypothetical protein FRB95_000873 [Tulasnella sp. JGI-2019a]|nr:hypothetical protein FRB95_000873 [Tulasnella sp. JGI-2019a]